MKKINHILFIIGLIMLCGACGSKIKNYKVNEEIKIEGTISTKVIEDEKVNVLNLENPIKINGETYEKIELEYDKNLKDNSKVTIRGNIDEDSSNFVLKVKDVDDIFSFINTFTSDNFKMTIPPELIKKVTIKEIENGFAIYSTKNLSSGGEVFKVYTVSRKVFNELSNNSTENIEKLDSNKEIVVIISYPRTTEYSEEYKDEYFEICNNLKTIKNSIKLK